MSQGLKRGRNAITYVLLLHDNHITGMVIWVNAESSIFYPLRTVSFSYYYIENMTRIKIFDSSWAVKYFVSLLRRLT